jgi:serine O-acetyltransferase
MTARLHDLTRSQVAEQEDEPDVFADTIEALAACAEDALSAAACGGLLDPNEVIDWTTRAKRLVLFQRDRSALRSEVPALADRLEALLGQVTLPPGVVARTVARRTIARLPAVRALLAEDVEASYAGDPASRSFDEIVVAYPSIRALTIFRIAHELHRLGVPLLPRIMTEYAHDRTGVDIHPGATIGRRCFIDHGTGVVIGETAEIGDRVRIYQGVTIGAASVRDSDDLRGRKRHPTIEDDVTIYAGATILGGATVIGRGSVIGGNVWITESVPAGSRVMAEPPRLLVRPNPDDASPPDATQLEWEI